MSDAKKTTLVLTEKEWRQRLTPEQYAILREKKTDPPKAETQCSATKRFPPGTYCCVDCLSPLFHAKSRFRACGWPAFEAMISGAVTIRKEADGTERDEAVCSTCQGHLGHVFLNEGLTKTNTRFCINQTILQFLPDKN